MVKNDRGTVNQVSKNNGQATNSISELYDKDGNLIGRGISNDTTSDPLFGKVQCSEGNCLIDTRFKLQSGQTYNLYTAQIKGKIPCSTCQEDLQIAANTSGATINAYSIGENGDVGRPLTFRPQSDTEYPDVVWDEETPLFDF